MSAFPQLSSSAASREILRQTFQRLDTDHDLTISLPELVASVQDDNVVAAMMRSMDADRNGRIDFKEFCNGFDKATKLTGSIEEADPASKEKINAAREERSAKTNDLLQSVFDFCDGDNSGLISSAETVMAMAYFFNRPLAFEEKFKIDQFFSSCPGNEMTFEKFKFVMVPWLLSSGISLKPPPRPLHSQIFSFVDADHSGTVSGEEALLGLKFLGKKVTDENKATILGLACFADGKEVDLDTFTTTVLPIMTSEERRKKELTVVEQGEKILTNPNLSADDKVKKIADLHDQAKKSDWLDKCGAYEQVNDSETELVSNFSSK
ncbi:hypothetical protein TrLO_g15012 [Triparma laevis f. longispina]|uniref:EF-hand domain-containing protein n=1 Tax=Triparma laevis f. longispina TaxID=1714387 RepID=A0A9W7F4I5_9STRA|nr:hypothetical protein TrLO_g15012 [Triparma laevis f. longispina]